MPVTLESPITPETLGFDDIIDVRTQAEFAIDHIPGTVNLPVLDDAERAEIGTIYVQDSRFRARRIGAALVARNIARHLDGYLSDKPAFYKPLIYCWRGGQRSASMALILRQIGWQAETLEGGYRSYRRLVVRQLYDELLPWKFRILDGNTGCGKTEILGLLPERGAQALDLEALANHRGSLFGDMPGSAQPSQKMFETRLLQTLGRLDPTRPVLIEGESSKIGALSLPPQLWAAMQEAPRILLSAPLNARARYLSRTYRDITGDQDRIAQTLNRLIPLQGRARVEHWQKLAANGAHRELAAELMQYHYDPAYRKSRAAGFARDATELKLSKLDTAELATAADNLADMLDVTAEIPAQHPVPQSAR